jgi:hypothetical protein
MALYYNGKALQKIITPVMRSNNQDGFKLSASSVYQELRHPYYAFDQTRGTTTTDSAWISESNYEASGLPISGDGEWLQVELPDPARILSYTLRRRGYGAGLEPVSWSLTGSNDNLTFNVLHRVNNYNWSATAYFGVSTALPAVAAFKYYRIVVHKTAAGIINAVAIGELELYGDNDLYFNGKQLHPDQSSAYFNGKLVWGTGNYEPDPVPDGQVTYEGDNLVYGTDNVIYK